MVTVHSPRECRWHIKIGGATMDNTENKRGTLPCDLPHLTITKEALYEIVKKVLFPYPMELYEHNDMDQDTWVISIRYDKGGVEFWEPDIDCEYWVITYINNDDEEASWDFIPEQDKGVYRTLAYTFCMDIQPFCDAGDTQYRLSQNNPNS
jgi:hypothetical protein